jgi:RHS repeat-associated protein
VALGRDSADHHRLGNPSAPELAVTQHRGEATQAYEVDSVGMGRTFTHDANGNLISDGTRSFEWDARNQLVAVTVGTHRSEFTYDGQQRRVRIIEKDNGIVQSNSKIVWCRREICEERAADGTTVARRAFGQGEQVSGANRYFAADHLGSIAEVTDGTASLSARYSFDPWGSRTLTSGTDLTGVGYTGHRWHSNASGWLTQYRFFDPAMGRWASEDPLGLEQGPNLYAYVVNNPLNTVDPDGRAAVAVAGMGICTAATAGACGAAAIIVTTAVIVTWWFLTKDECYETEQQRCARVRNECLEYCVDLGDWQGAGFRGSDAPSVLRKCIRSCMAKRGCFSY